MIAESGRLIYFLNDFKLYIVLIFLTFILLIFSLLRVKRSGVSETSKKLSISILFGFFFLVLIFSFFEAYFRYIYDESDGLGFLNTNQRWLNRHVVFNTYGYRDRDFSINKPPGTMRIGVVGDSLAMGYGIKNVDDRFSNILEKKFRANGVKVEVYNMGVSGLDTCSEIKEFDRVKQLKFDLIVWEYFPNDVQPCDEKSTGAKVLIDEVHHVNPILKFIEDQSFFLEFIYWRISPEYSQTYMKLRKVDLAQYKNPPVIKQHLADIATFSKTLQDNSSTHQVVVIIFPFFFILDKNYSAKDIHKMLDEYFTKQNDSVIDLMPYLIDQKKAKLTVNRFDAHPNEYVHDLAASFLYGRITRILKDMKENEANK